MSSQRYDHYSFQMIKTKSTKPIQLHCQQCGQTGKTLVDTDHTKYTYAACTGIAMVGGFLGCCVIPFYLDEFKNAEHSCSTCGCELAYKKAFDKTPDADINNQGNTSMSKQQQQISKQQKGKSDDNSFNLTPREK
eukprot:403375556